MNNFRQSGRICIDKCDLKSTFRKIYKTSFGNEAPYLINIIDPQRRFEIRFNTEVISSSLRIKRKRRGCNWI